MKKHAIVCLSIIALGVLLIGCASEQGAAVSSQPESVSTSATQVESTSALATEVESVSTSVVAPDSASASATEVDPVSASATAPDSASASGPDQETASPSVSSESTALLPAQEADSAYSSSDQPVAEEAHTQITVSTPSATLVATLADTEAARALAQQLEGGPITVNLHEYGGFEKIGNLPEALPAADEQITTQVGDIVLYQGNQISIFYGSNSWTYTRLGHIEGFSANDLLDALGGSEETAVELSLA